MIDCSDCGSEHLGFTPCGLTFRERISTVQVDLAALETRTKRRYFDQEAVRATVGPDAKERLMDETKGYGAAETDAQGRVWAKDPKTHEPLELSPQQANEIYLSGPVVSEA